MCRLHKAGQIYQWGDMPNPSVCKHLTFKLQTSNNGFAGDDGVQGYVGSGAQQRRDRAVSDLRVVRASLCCVWVKYIDLVSLFLWRGSVGDVRVEATQDEIAALKAKLAASPGDKDLAKQLADKEDELAALQSATSSLRKDIDDLSQSTTTTTTTATTGQYIAPRYC